MSRIPLQHRHYTVEEYFEIDEAAETRHEFVDGQIYDMAGGSNVHSQITVNLISELRNRLRGRPRQARDGNLRVRYGRKVRYGYPDALIFCKEPEFDPKARSDTTLLNPTVLFEVLSKSTASYDRGEKFGYYRDIDSLQEYVLIAQDRPSVQVYRRRATGLWAIEPPIDGLESTVALTSAEIELPLADLYEGVQFPPEKAVATDDAE